MSLHRDRLVDVVGRGARDENGKTAAATPPQKRLTAKAGKLPGRRATTPIIASLVGVVRANLVLLMKTGRIGVRACFYGRAPILHLHGSFTFGDLFRTRSSQFRPALTVDRGARLAIGDDVFINQGATIHASKHVAIGSRVLIGDLVCIYDSDFHAVIPGEHARQEHVIIADDVWIGRGALILPGVTIGPGAVVGAGAVVTSSVPAGTVVAGNPARVVRRFELQGGQRR